MRKTLKRIVGAILLLVGLLALVTPFTPGSWLAFVGLELLGLSFLLPRPVRTRWEAFKMQLWQRWQEWLGNRRRRKATVSEARANTPHAGGTGA